VFANNTQFSCDIDVRALSLPPSSTCVLCREEGAMQSCEAVPNGVTCFLTVDTLWDALRKNSVDKSLKQMVEAAVQKPPGDLIDEYGVLYLFEQPKNVTFRKLSTTIDGLVQEAGSIGVPRHTDRLVLDLLAHQDGHDIFVFENESIQAPLVLKQMLDGCSEFWKLAGTAVPVSCVILWSCVSNMDAITQLLANMPSIVLLCFRGPIHIQTCLLPLRQHLFGEISMKAPNKPKEFAEWLAGAVKMCCSDFSIGQCLPVVITHNQRMYVNK
jgi:hypothetical protein